MTKALRESFADIAADQIKSQAHELETNLPTLFVSFFELNKKLTNDETIVEFHKDWAMLYLKVLGIVDVSNLKDAFNAYMFVQCDTQKSFPNLTQFHSLSQALYSCVFTANLVFNINSGKYDDIKKTVLESSFLAVKSLTEAAKAVTEDDEVKSIKVLDHAASFGMVMQYINYVQDNFKLIYETFGYKFAAAIVSEMNRCTKYFLRYFP